MHGLHCYTKESTIKDLLEYLILAIKKREKEYHISGFIITCTDYIGILESTMKDLLEYLILAIKKGMKNSGCYGNSNCIC